MLRNPRSGVLSLGFLLSHELDPCGAWEVSDSALPSNTSMDTATTRQPEPNVLAKSFTEILKIIPESPAGGRAIERHPGRAQGGVKPRCRGAARVGGWV